MIINGRDVARYYASHSREQIHTVIQTLQAFGFHRELELWLKNGLHVKKKYSPELVDKLERLLKPFPGKCPWCKEEKLQGCKITGCEHKESGRTWYEECTVCKYYREEFRR
jgi:hypothetical protein